MALLEGLSPQEIEQVLAGIDKLSLEDKLALMQEIDALEEQKRLQRCRDDFLVFCHEMYPSFKEGAHHRHLKPMLHDMVSDDPAFWEGRERPPHALRLTVSMAPRFGKSITISFLYVAWYLGHNPTHHIMMVTHTATLSEGFGRQIRDLIDTQAYQKIFPGTKVSKDKSAAGDWTTTAGGKYLAVGVGANVAGHGAHLLICDDLVSEQAVLANSDTAFETAWTYVQTGPLQRLMPGGRIVMIGTRWGKKDPIGKALKWAKDNPESLPWHEVRFPAVMEVQRDGETVTISLWPEQWPLDQLLAKKAGMAPHFWAAQYMQDPTTEEAALLKREWWQIWEKDEPPPYEFVIQAWDTAHETKNHNDYSACLTWGVWFNERTSRYELILLDAWKGRLEFPDLKEKAQKMAKHWEPEALLIEKKAAGGPLIQELRRTNLIIEELNPSRGARGVSNDKRARVNAVAPILKDKLVWVPDMRWAQEVMDECAEFPNGDHDDMVDCVEMALSRFRRGGFISLSDDAEDNGDDLKLPRRAAYY